MPHRAPGGRESLGLRGGGVGTWREDRHAHNALQPTVATGGAFAIRTERETVSGPLVLIAPDVPHVFEARGRNAVLVVEPASRLGAALLREFAGAPAHHLDPVRLPDMPEQLAPIGDRPRLPDDGMVALSREMLERHLRPAPEALPPMMGPPTSPC